MSHPFHLQRLAGSHRHNRRKGFDFCRNTTYTNYIDIFEVGFYTLFEESQIIRDTHWSDRSGEYCETGLRIGDLPLLTTEKILELKGKQNKISWSRKAKQKNPRYVYHEKLSEAIAMPKTSRVPIKGAHPISPKSSLQAVKSSCRIY